MVETHQWLLPTNDGIPRLQKPPLLYWLIIASFKLLGVNAAAARLPGALAVVASVALDFFDWRKAHGLLARFHCGSDLSQLAAAHFLLARIVMPEPLVSAFMAGAMFCGLCGYQRRRHRRVWFAGFWICSAFACLTKGVTRHCLSGCDFSFAVDLLSRSADAISRAFAMGICCRSFF